MSDERAELAKQFARLPARYFVALGLVAAALLALTQPEWASRFGLAGFPPWTRLALTATALVSVTVAAIKRYGVWEAQRTRAQEAAARTAAGAAKKLAALETLSPYESQLLRWCVAHQTRTVYLAFNHPIAVGLVGRGLMTMAQQGTAHATAYTVNPIAWKAAEESFAAVAPEVRERWQETPESFLYDNLG